MIKAINRMKNNKGFTLVELIVVLAVLLILAAISIPKLTGVKEDAAVRADKATAANLAKAAEMYIQMNDIARPTSETEITTTLTTKKYITTNDLTPQVTGKTTFKVKHDANNINVYYDDETTAVYTQTY